MKIKIAFLTTRDDSGNPQIGDCIVVTFDETFDEGDRKACIVIDGGYASNKTVLKKYLESEQIKTIDLIIATHIDNDHISGLKAFLNSYVTKLEGKKKKFELRNYWGPAPKDYTAPMSIMEFVSYIDDIDKKVGMGDISFISQSVKANEELYEAVTDILNEDHIFNPSVMFRDNIPKIFNSIYIDILAPDNQIPSDEIKGHRLNELSLGKIFSSNLEIDLDDSTLRQRANDAAKEINRTANNQSIVIKMTPLGKNGHRIETNSFLFTGDAEIESWDYMIRSWSSGLESKLLKISHHGSKTGTNEEVLKTVKPEYCIICAGKNSHGLPDEEVLKMIDNENLERFCTGRNTNEKESPCVKNNVLKKCPRWDNVKKEHIKDHIIFDYDTDTSVMNFSGESCGYNW